MYTSSTIVALATASGVGAIAVIRISGSESLSLIDQVFKSHKGKILKEQKSHTLHLGFIFDEKNIIDEVLVSIFKNPHSYTGEDIVEISCHGSVFIQQQIIQILLQKGALMAQPGEFTLRAFLNGKMDLSQAEAVADLIASNSAASHQIAMQQMRGGITSELKNLRSQLLDFAALIELELDFSGEDVEFADREKFKVLIAKISTILKRLIDSFTVGNALKNGIPVAIIGKPNVGKSTLLNTLLNEDRAIVSEVAGTTRDAIEDEVIIEGVVFRFIDTAGIRETEDIVESIGIKKTFEKAEKAQLIILIIDIKVEIMEQINQEIDAIKKRFPTKKLLVINNKVDLLSELETKFITNEIDNLILLSAKNKIGIDVLKKELISLVNLGALSNNETIVANARHFEALNNALLSIEAVRQGVDKNIPSDLFSIDVRDCLRYLGTITGEYDVDKDILGHIFSNFCIGK